MAEQKEPEKKEVNNTEGGGEKNEAVSSATDAFSNIASPEGIIMLFFATLFDTVGLVPIVGTFFDILAGIFFSMWMIVSGKKGWWRFAIALVLEAIPIISDIMPFVSLIGIAFNIKLPVSWIGCVYSILTGQGGLEKKIAVKANA